MQNLLDEAIATAAASLVLLELNEFKLTERLKDSLQILLSDVEVNVADIKTVKGDRIWVTT